MDISEVKRIIKTKVAVIYDGIEYERVLNCILWLDKEGKYQYSLELKDKNGLSVTKAPMEKVTIKEQK